jgi:hypothetical protein
VTLGIEGITGGPVGAVVANWTITEATDRGFLTAYAAGTPRPATSTMNAEGTGDTIANLGIVTPSTAGVTAFASAGTHLVVDVTGWFTGAPIAATEALAPNPPPPRPRALLVGDSTMAGIRWYGNSRVALQGFDFVLDVESCRRLATLSCRGREGRTPPNAVQAIQAAPGTFDIVVVQTGYNDVTSTFSWAFDQVVAAARAKGAERIVWLTYRRGGTYSQPGTGTWGDTAYASHNATLAAKVASGQFDDVVLADWNTYTSQAAHWFTPDGIHFTVTGAYGASDFISRHIAHLGKVPCPVPQAPGWRTPNPCGDPDTIAPVPDVMTLYGGSPAELHCYEVGLDRHIECRVDPKLG